MPAKHIYVLGYDEMNRNELDSVHSQDEYIFHPLLYCGEMITQQIDAGKLLRKSLGIIRQAKEAPDAIIGHWDFPVSTMIPLLNKEAGLQGASFESVLKCEHKYWCRTEQKKAIPEYIPEFSSLNPFADDPVKDLKMDYPFWIKPVKSVSSVLGFLIHNEQELRYALRKIRKEINWSADPFNFFFEQCDAPDDIKPIDGYHCLVEEIISDGRQCTQEGFALNGDISIYGTIDSWRYPDMSCFRSYEYPSHLPPEIIDRMTQISKTIIPALGYDNAPFNIEYFWNEETGQIKILEINPRISQSHSPLFRLVDGQSHHHIAIKTALQQRPDFPSRQGAFPYAAKFMHRTFEDGIVRKAPGIKEIKKLRQDIPELKVINLAVTGQRLSDMIEQDSYSYELANIYIGGYNKEDVFAKYQRVVQGLGYEIEKTTAQTRHIKA